MLNTPYGPLSEIDQVDNVHTENSSPSEMAILSPHAIPTDLIEPQATWDRLPQMEDHKNDYGYKQALKPRRSIADKLSSMVERGWVGGDTVCKDDYEFASHTTESTFHIGDTRRDSRSDSLSETRRPKKVPSYSGSLSVSTAETRSESQHSIGQDALHHVKQKEPLRLLNRETQKRSQRQTRHSPAADTTPRSSSESGVHYLKTELAKPTGKRRAWTLHHLGRFTSNYSQIQKEASPTTSLSKSYARNHHSSEPDQESTKSIPPREGSIPKSVFEPLRGEQFHTRSEDLSKATGSRCSGSHAKESSRTASRSTSFFKKFPWYKVALVDKPVIQGLLKEGQGNDKTSRSSRAAQHDPTANQIELSRGVSKSHTLAGCGHEVDENALKTDIPPNQGPINQQAMDARTSHYKQSSQPSLQLMMSPQEMNEQQLLEQSQRALERPQNSHATSFKNTQEGLSGNPHQVVKDVIKRAQSPTGTGLSGRQPRVFPQSGSMDASFESAISGDILRSLQPQWLGVKEHSGMQPYTSSSADSMKQRAHHRPEQGSSGSGTARAEEGLTASRDPDQQLESKVVDLFPECSETWTDSLPPSVHRSDQHEPVHREVKGRGKGIKKIQVTVTFDGAEDLVIEAQLQNKDRHERWRTMA